MKNQTKKQSKAEQILTAEAERQKKIDDAKKLLEAEEKAKLEKARKLFENANNGINELGYSLIPVGQFVGSRLKVVIQLAKK